MMSEKFLFKKFGYKVLEVKTTDDVEQMFIDYINGGMPKYFAYDTETTGLNFMKDVPFLVIFGFNKYVYIWDANFKEATQKMFKIVQNAKKMLFAHNAKYDYHMLHNIGTPIPEDIELSDSITLFRLISDCDDDFQSMRLEKLGEKYVDPEAKFAGHEIQKMLERKMKNFYLKYLKLIKTVSMEKNIILKI